MKTAVITGATSGIGFAVAEALAAKGWRVIGVGRTAENCGAARARLLKARPDVDVLYFWGDLSEQNDVHRVADEITGHLDTHCGGRLNALINNAGGVRGRYITTAEGYEIQFALNHLAGFLLTYRLMDALKKGAGRLILTGSGSHRMMRMRWHDIMFQKRYSPLFAYKQSKLAGMLFASEFNRRFAGMGVRAYVVDPGLVDTDIGSKQTSGLVHAFWSLRRRGGVMPETAAASYACLCGEEKTPDGLYYRQCRPRAYSKQADIEDDAKRLFALSERLCGITFEEGVS
ncbi:MAG: SDR family NAD(P)-dependent oxidoreductase [Eubacteriales bacterium]|nr:SDR family NAD(P)-dependent oxidoreductase [Eubacteriales bacterium]